MLQEETLRPVGDNGRLYEEPDGEYVELISMNNNTISILTRVDAEKGGEGGEEETEPPFDPSSSSVAGLKEKLDLGSSTEEELAALLEAEKDGKNRKTAKAAIEDHLQ